MSTDTSQSGTWRRKALENSGESIRRSTRRWQQEKLSTESDVVVTRRKRYGIRAIGWLLGGLATLALLLYLLLYDPNKTPTLTLAATGAGWPLPPNAWAAEDIEKLRKLDGSTLRMFDLSESATSKEAVLESFDASLKTVARQPNKNQSVVIYISMIGLIDERGTPCLAADDADPLDRSTWLPVSDLLNKIHATLPADTNKLVLLDAVPFRSAWQLGIVENTFADRLPAVIEELALPRLAVLHSTSSGQRNEGSSEIKSSPFGYFSQLGLAGKADQAEGGNGDGSISARELQAYLADEVNRWSLENRGLEQTPVLLPDRAGDFHVSFALRGSSLSSLEEEAATVSRIAPSVNAEQIESLWEKVHRLAGVSPVQFAPLKWARLHNHLQWLEQAATAGTAYEVAAQRVHQSLSAELDSMLQLAEEPGRASSLPLAESVFLKPTQIIDKPLRPHSIELGEYFGAIDSLAANRGRDALNRIVNDSDTVDLRIDIDTKSGPQSSLEYEDFYFLSAAAKCQVLTTLRDQGTLIEIMRLRERAEQVAVPRANNGPGDPRLHRWIRASVELGDQHRRAVEDGALAGMALSSLQADIDAAAAAYEQAATAMHDLTIAINLRDQIRAEAPYLARWLCDASTKLRFDEDLTSTPDGDLAGEAARKTSREVIEQTLLPLIESTRELSNQLSQPVPADPRSAITTIAESTAGVAAHWSRLQQFLDSHCLELTDSDQRDALTLAAIESVLNVPSLTTDTRQALRKRLQSIRRTLSEGYSSAKETEADEAVPPMASITFTPAAEFSSHPLVALLALDGNNPIDSVTGATDADVAEAISGFVRARMLALVNQAEGTDELSDPASAGNASGRLAYHRQAEHLRSLAAVFPSASLAGDPAMTQRWFDLQQLLLWRATRALDDFWGPLPAKDAQAKPDLLFQLTANDYLTASNAALAASPAVEEQMDRIRQAILIRSEAAKRGVDLWANSASLFDLNEDLKANVRVLPGIAAEALPTGKAAVFIENNEKLVRPEVVATPAGTLPMIQLPFVGDQATELMLQLPSAIIQDPTLAAVISFRGHWFTSPFFIEGMEGISIRSQPREAGIPQVTLFGDRRQRSSIVFVLDCSYSMRDEILVEAMGDERRSRLDLAKSALESMLSELALRGESRVGVRFFGHRVAWSSDDPLRVMPQNRYGRTIPEGLAPSEDVEAVQTLGRFDTIEAGKVIRLMQTVEGWGQSPLNLTLTQALGDFSRDDRETDKSIIVITDGVDFQYTPIGVDNRTAGKTTIASVKEAWRKQSVPVHILGFGIAAEERDQAEEDFRSIARETGGSYHLVSNGLDLLRLLNEQLGLGGYYLENANGNVVTGMLDGAPSLIQLNTPASPNDWNHQTSTYQLRFRDLAKPLTLYGGETLQLVLTTGGTDIDAVPYDRNFPVARELTTGNPESTTGYLLRCHQPLLHNGRVTFPVSWQDQRTHFTERLAEMWMVASPVNAEGNDMEPSYIFYDINYVPGKPVPVVELTADNWPPESRQARVRLICKPEATEPSQIIPLADVNARPQEFNDGVDLRSGTGVNLRVETRNDDRTNEFLVSAIEQHGEESEGIDSLKIELAGPIPAQEIIHQYDAKHRIVVHTFRFPADAKSKLLSGDAALRITTFDDLRDGSWHLPRNRPVLLNIQQHADVFPPEAADVPLPLPLQPPSN